MAIQQISGAEIADGTVIAADIADGSVTGPKLGLTAINANNIVDGSITQAKLDPAIDLGVNPLLFAGQ